MSTSALETKRGTLLITGSLRGFLAVASGMLLFAGSAGAVVVQRQNWVPVGAGSAVGKNGDLWTFVCPSRGTVSVTVNNVNDSPADGGGIDPVMAIYDGEGNLLVVVDDTINCSVPKCGGGNAILRCPQVTNLSCGSGKLHSLAVRDFATCLGSYTITLEVRDSKGVSLPESKVRLGGGPKRKLPKWISTGGLQEGPAIDDAQVPNF